jgi:hypothetical protein
MTGAGIDWAFFHAPPSDLGESDDCDIAASKSGPEVLADLKVAFGDAALRPILHSNYDIGRGDAIWFWGDSCESIVHLDILSDETAMNRLGINTARLLRSKQNGCNGDIAATEFQALYRLSKNAWVGRRLPTFDTALWNSKASAATLGSSFRPQVLNAQIPEAIKRIYVRVSVNRVRLSRHGLRLITASVRRFISRLVRRSGRWIHVSGQDSLEVALRVQSLLEPEVQVTRKNRHSSSALLECISARFETVKPKVYITAGRMEEMRCADAVVDAAAWLEDEPNEARKLMKRLATITYQRLE